MHSGRSAVYRQASNISGTEVVILTAFDAANDEHLNDIYFLVVTAPLTPRI